KTGAPFRLGADPDQSLVAPDDAHHRCQSEPSAGELGGKERVKDAAKGVRRHAGAGIVDLEVDHFFAAVGRALGVADERGEAGLVELASVEHAGSKGDVPTRVL